MISLMETHVSEEWLLEDKLLGLKIEWKVKQEAEFNQHFILNFDFLLSKSVVGSIFIIDGKKLNI